MGAPHRVEGAREPRPIEPPFELDSERRLEARRADAPQLAIEHEDEAVGAGESERSWCVQCRHGRAWISTTPEPPPSDARAARRTSLPNGAFRLSRLDLPPEEWQRE